MVIRKTDSVAEALRRDESLIDVFIELSPAFERLRNPAMRKVMARLVTVEQAARIAGVDSDELVRRLNGGVAAAAPADARMDETATQPAPADAGLPAALQGTPMEKIVEIDVREDLRAGREPFSRIMAARRQLPAGGVLALRAIFEPVPLYAVMAKQGFAHYTECLGDADWRVWFYRAEQQPAPSRRLDRSASLGPDSGEAEQVVVLDVRDLEPPEPMIRTLAALENLPPGGTLVQINVRVPEFLLPRLEERDFSYEVREQAPDLVRVFIRRAERTEAARHFHCEPRS